jgi:hypothetical protein
VNTFAGPCDCCDNNYSTYLTSGDEGESWVCPSCVPIDIELSRDADKVVTAISVRIDCRHCHDWSSGSYRAAWLGHVAHLEHCRGRR